MNKADYFKLAELILAENGEKGLSPEQTSTIYTIIHLLSGRCKNPHTDLQEKIEKDIKQLKKDKLM